MTASYTALVDDIAAEIAAGRLKAGERLPPQRQFAYERGIAASTAARVYAELLRRGLVVGEVGRGTFVAGHERRVPPLRAGAVRRPHRSRIQLSDAARPGRADREVAQRLAAAGGARTRRLRRSRSVGWPRPAGSAPISLRAIAGGRGRRISCSPAAAGSRSPPRSRHWCRSAAGLRSRPVTYPMVKGIAARLGVTLVPIAMDGEGIRPDALAKAHRAARAACDLSAAGDAQSARPYHERDAARGDHASGAQARPDDHRGSGLWLSQRRAPARGAGGGAHDHGRQPLQAARAGDRGRLPPCARAVARAARGHRAHRRLVGDAAALAAGMACWPTAPPPRSRAANAPMRAARQAIVAECLAGHRSWPIRAPITSGSSARGLARRGARPPPPPAPASRSRRRAPLPSRPAIRRTPCGWRSACRAMTICARALTRLAGLLAARHEESDMTE